MEYWISLIMLCLGSFTIGMFFYAMIGSYIKTDKGDE